MYSFNCSSANNNSIVEPVSFCKANKAKEDCSMVEYLPFVDFETTQSDSFEAYTETDSNTKISINKTFFINITYLLFLWKVIYICFSKKGYGFNISGKRKKRESLYWKIKWRENRC